MRRSKRVVRLALFSGILSFVMLWVGGESPNWLPVPDALLRFSPGLIFGVLVLFGQCEGLPARWPRTFALIAGTTIIYFLMVRLANSVGEAGIPPLAACGIAGGLGALLTALSLRLFAARDLSMLAVLMGFVLGTLGGCLIGQAIVTPEIDAIVQMLVLSGFMLWQGGVAFALLVIDPMGDEPERVTASSPE